MGSVAVEEKLNSIRGYEKITAMTQIVLLDRSFGIMAILVGILLAMLCLGVPLTKYKGHWAQWSMSSRIGFLLLFASVVGLTMIALQWIVWNATVPDFIM